MKKLIELLSRAQGAGVLTVSELLVLLTIAQSDGKHTMVTVSEALDLPLSSTSRLIWNLVQKELIEQVAVEGDRRKRILKCNVKKVSAALDLPGLKKAA